jgi:hypothetical protein
VVGRVGEQRVGGHDVRRLGRVRARHRPRAVVEAEGVVVDAAGAAGACEQPAGRVADEDVVDDLLVRARRVDEDPGAGGRADDRVLGDHVVVRARRVEVDAVGGRVVDDVVADRVPRPGDVDAVDLGVAGRVGEVGEEVAGDDRVGAVRVDQDAVPGRVRDRDVLDPLAGPGDLDGRVRRRPGRVLDRQVAERHPGAAEVDHRRRDRGLAGVALERHRPRLVEVDRGARVVGAAWTQPTSPVVSVATKAPRSPPAFRTFVQSLDGGGRRRRRWRRVEICLSCLAGINMVFRSFVEIKDVLCILK